MRSQPWVLSAMLLGSCVFSEPAPEPESEVEVPSSWGTRSPAGEIGGRWWFTFEDTALNALVDEALARNLELQASAETVRAALSAAELAGADRLPHASAGARAERQKQIWVGLPIPGRDDIFSTRATSYGVSLDVSWEIDLWGRLSARAEAGSAEFRASYLEHHAAALSLIAQVSKSWFALRESRAQLRLAERTLASRRKALEIVQSRYQSGLVPALDARLTETLMHAAEAAVQRRTLQLDAARRSLEILVGRYPAAELTSSADLPALPPAPPAGLPADILDRRPDLRAARTQLLALRYRASEAEASLYPALSLTASAGTRSAQLGDLVNGNFSVWSLLGNLVQPIYQGGRLRANVDIAESRVRESAQHFGNLVLRACLEVEHALAAEGYLVRQVRAQADALESARLARDLALDRYQNGQLGVLTFLDSERSVFDSESLLLETQRAALQNRIDLHLALGGDMAVQSPVPEEETPFR